MITEIKTIINDIICCFFGHKTPDESIMAYNIDVQYLYIKVEIYIISRCKRCDKVVCRIIDWYEKCSWYSGQLAKEEENTLRKRGVISVAEAYQKIEKED